MLLQNARKTLVLMVMISQHLDITVQEHPWFISWFSFPVFQVFYESNCADWVGQILTSFLAVFFWCMHQREALHEVIHVRGCIHAVNLWMSDNIGITIALCCAIGLPQVIENSQLQITESETEIEAFRPNASQQLGLDIWTVKSPLSETFI